MSVLIAISFDDDITPDDEILRREAPLRLGAQIARRGDESLTILTVIKREVERLSVAAEATLAQAREIVQPHTLSGQITTAPQNQQDSAPQNQQDSAPQNQQDSAPQIQQHSAAEVHTRVRIGHPAIEIVREAEEGGYDLVIVGEEPTRNLMERFLTGSTAVRVVEHSPCPVIVAKGRIRPFQRVLVCDSGSGDPSLGTGPGGPSVLQRFTEIPVKLLEGALRQEIVVLHVMSQMSAGPGVEGTELRSGVEELLKGRTPEGELLGRDIELLESLNLRAHAKVRHGLVVEEILDEVKGGDYDLVVIGAYRGQGWQRILLNDLTHRLVVDLDRPVLVVR